MDDQPIIIEDKIPQEKLSAEDKMYLHGAHNKAIRLYYYLKNGLYILNDFRNLFLGIFALYVALKLNNLVWAVVIFIFSSIFLTYIGRYNVHKLSKMQDWLGTRFSSHYGIRNYDNTKMQTKLLLEIRDLLKDQNKK